MSDDTTTAAELTLRRTLPARPERIWTLWTTPDGIAAWWAPDGFATTVDALDLRPGGSLVHTMTAVGTEQIEFMKQAGLPVATTSHKTFTVVEEPVSLAYTSLIDFVPGHDPYDHLTTVTLQPAGDATGVVMQIDPLHDPEWTARIVAGRSNELDNLQRLLTR